ncbi:MAG: glycosyltransferase [Gemmataceae bacterium]
MNHVKPANLFGLGTEWLNEPYADPAAPRPYDVAFVGNLNSAVQSENLAWLGRLGQLSSRYRITIQSGIFGEEYRNLLRNSKLVFNRSNCGEMNLQAFEACAAGAVLLQESDNREIHTYLNEGTEFVSYNPDNLERVIDEILSNDQRRIEIAKAAQNKVKQYSFETLLDQAIDSLNWEEVTSRANERVKRFSNDVEGEYLSRLRARVWQRINLSGIDFDPELAIFVNHTPFEHDRGILSDNPQTALQAFRRAAPGNRVSQLAYAELMISTGERERALDTLKQLAHNLSGDSTLTEFENQTVPYALGSHSFRVDWERAGWSYAGRDAGERRAKHALLQARVYTRLGDLTGESSAYESALRFCPDESGTQMALGCAYARAGKMKEAIPLLRSVLEKNPFYFAAARAYFQAALDAGHMTLAQSIARDRRRLRQAAPDLIPDEVWFATEKPVGDELTSIIILCCNQFEVTKQCLESLFAHTRLPYELIFVDNGSLDGTSEYLAKFSRRNGPKRVHIISNSTNLGFAAGVNQGLAAVEGDWIVLLNNDTVVTPHWLDRLLLPAVRDWPKVGFVGPVTNEAPPPQRVNPAYTSFADLPAFAESIWSQQSTKTLSFPRLTGFCLAGHKSVFNTLGRLDEEYGTGFFEDDDLCVRARRAGYELRVALGVYLHHHGSRTFAALGIDTSNQLEVNFETFKRKWGDAEAAPYRKSFDAFTEHKNRDSDPPLHSDLNRAVRSTEEPLGHSTENPTASISGSTDLIPSNSTREHIRRSNRAFRVSLTMIVKNEEKNLGACLQGLSAIFDEIIVVDTGSTDRTRAIALEHGAQLGEFPWVDDFARARNAALDRATGDYVFWLDADDRIDEANRQKLTVLLDSLNDSNRAFVVKCRCVPDRPGGTATIVDHVRLFPRLPGIRWEHRVHEQILPSLRRSGTDIQWSDVTVDHVGYVDPALRKTKLGRDMRILEKELADQPNHPFTLFNMGSVYGELGDDRNALICLGKSLAGSHPNDSITRKLFALIAQCHRRLGRIDDARAAIAEGCNLFPDDAELLFLNGVLAQEAKDWNKAETIFRNLVNGSDVNRFASVDTGLRGVKARHNLASIYFETGRLDEASREWRAALTLDPAFVPALAGLNEIARITELKAGQTA